MKLRHAPSLLTSCFLLAAGAGSASAAAPPPDQFGFRGLKRIELVFVNVGRTMVSGSVAGAPTSPEVPADDLARQELAKDPECAAIAKTIPHAGLEVVEKCKNDDLACAELYLTVENDSTDRSADRLYLVGVELSQRLLLARDEKAVLKMPVTWSAHRITVVPADHSARAAACIDLRSLATAFGSFFRMTNQ